MNREFRFMILAHFVKVYSASLPSEFYQPTSGVYFERWTSTTYYGMSSFNSILNYPDCPQFISHSDKFSYSEMYTEIHQYGRFRTSFVADQTGIHKFFAILNNMAQVYIELNPTGLKKILDINAATNDNWDDKKWCDDVLLMKGFRYEITVYHYGDGYNKDFFKLGVKFPNDIVLTPINSTYLQRSMKYYKWNGLLAHKFDNFQFPSDQSEYTLAKAYSMNPAYPSNPVSYLCKSTIYEPSQKQFEYYALKFIGYMSVPETGTYKFKMTCNELCQINMTISGSIKVLGHYNDAWSTSFTEMNAGTLSNDTLYPFTIFFCESFGYDFIQVSYKKGSDVYSTSWTGRLRNLAPNDTESSLPMPVPVMVNSTAISVMLPSKPYLPPKDNWTYVQNHEILYHRSGVEEAPKKLVVIGALPQTVIANGLRKYIDYVFYAHYFGKINGEDQNIITRYSVVMKTDEDVPDSAPPSVVVDKRSSTSIRCRWGSFSSLSLWNGIGIGYEVQYRLKGEESGNWTSVETSGASNRQYTAISLLKYRIYEFQVAGRTIKGSGVFSGIKEERTMEDVPSAGPSNITALNSSSSSIVVTWDDVPEEHQNGIIIGYRVYIRKSGSNGDWSGHDTGSKQWSKSGLDLWAFYDIKLSAKTLVGEGAHSSTVNVRTDEDVPGAAPVNIAAAPLSSSSVNITWSEIVEEKRYGVILSYKLKYKRADGIGVLKDVVVPVKYCAIGGLAQSVAYEITVAGMTIKGDGVFSSKLTISTNEDAPSAPPQNLRGNFTNATAIRLHWDLVQQQDRNGIIRKYAVQFRIKDSSSVWQEIVVGPDFLTLHVLKLEYYTVYEFKIAAETAIGRGPFSSVVFIRTDAYAPSKSPINVTGHFLDQQSINITWSRVPKEHRQGIIEGYKLYYADKTIPDISWHSIVIPNRHGGGDLFNQTVKGLKTYTPYLFKISAFTYKAEGVLSDNVTVWTDEYKPTEPPKNISGVNASSTEVILRWLDMKEIDGEANGEVLGYTVRYRVVDCYKDRPKGCDENKVFNITSYGKSPEIKIPNLRKYTKYNMQVQVFNSKGKGHFSTSINITTDEDIPDEPPTIIETWPSQQDSIKIYWSPIPESHRNGIILGYRVFYKAIDEPQRRYDRAPRSVNDFAIYGALPGEKMVEVNSTANSVEIKELEDFSWYEVRIGAFTSKGLGVTFTINGTTAQRSPIEAPLLKVTDMIGFEEISLEWTEISKAGARGEVLGYQIQYWLSELHENPMIESKKHSFEVLAPNRTAMIRGLQAFAKYRIRILAFNEGGFGVWSQEHGGGTCRCSKFLSSAKIILPPLVNSENQEILPALLDQAITSCCGSCSGKHGATKVNWEKDSRNYSSIKYSKQEALDAIVAGTNLALPIFRDSFEIEGDVDSSEYIMVPLIESKYVAIFKRNPTEKELGNAASAIITNSLWEQYPILVISAVMTLLAAILFWIFESGKNVAEFPKSFVRGAGSGLWLAYITMTTVGYGDLTPITKLGKMFTMIWMLIGLVLTSMIVGALSSAFSLEFVLQPRLVEKSDKVLASQELLMIASRLKAGRVTIGNTSDGKFVQDSLLSGNVSTVALDIYTAGTLKDYLLHPQIFMEETQMITASYSVALGGETKRIRKCIGRFTSENAKSVLEKLDQLTFLYQRGSAKPIELFNYIGSSHSDIMENATLYCGILLAVLVGFGVICEIARHIRGRGKVETESKLTMRMSDEIFEGIVNLEKNISEKIDKIEASHAQERMKLKKMKIGQLSALLYMYPALTKFDPDLAKLKGEAEEPAEYYQTTTISQAHYYSSEEEESDNDRPMDLKVGN